MNVLTKAWRAFQAARATRAAIASRRRAAHRGGFFWMPCPICGEHFAGFEAVTDPVLYTSVYDGILICPKPACADEARERNRLSGLDDQRRRFFFGDGVSRR
jgi:hypothetical protein